MDIYVLNRKLEFVGVVDAYTSVIWTTRYYEAGDFELYLPASIENVLLLKEDFYLCREQDVDGDTLRNVMIIETVNPATDVENGNYLTITGRCLKSLLSRRIIWEQTTINGNLENGIRKIITDNVISPVIAARKMERFTLSDAKGFQDKIEIQNTGDEVSEFLKSVCTAYGIGWDVYINKGQFVFELYKGVDRSYDQDVNPYVVFSPEFDNLIDSNYVYSKSNYKNVALVAGEGEGKSRVKAAVGSALTGLDRYELFVDARDVSSNDGEITEDDYVNLLVERGNEKLSELGIVESFEGQIEVNSSYTLNEDYFLGDIVNVMNEFGIETTPRIIEIIDCDDETGRSVIPTFSTWEV